MNLWNPFSAVTALSLIFCLSFRPELKAQNRKKLPLASCQKEIKQGIKGLIFEVSGNQMPSPGKGVPIRKGVQREFGIFKLSRLDLAARGKADCFFKSTGTPLVKRARSEKDGCFALSLPPGKYSIFVREKGQWYANSFGGEGEICPFEVFPDSLSQLDFRINHGAWY
jgi:hypothetical protein